VINVDKEEEDNMENDDSTDRVNDFASAVARLPAQCVPMEMDIKELSEVFKGCGINRDKACQLLMCANGDMNEAALLITEKGRNEKRKRDVIRAHKDASSQ